ncbi:MAG: hypothetical protein QNJ42_04895 [Crocosphaera sp.]|nr:hypothetical protein [Crocosphaera sp.]
MDPSNQQPYKSKLFNFVNRRSSQWRDRLIHSAQYLRVGIEWSLQILIYPIYLMVQAGRATRKQLRLGFTAKALPTHQNKTASSTPTVDQSLSRVFKETEHCLIQTKTQQKTDNQHNQKTPVMIQGMASEIESHALVLVAENNTIIDILSETQQQHLKKYIRLETANYWYDFKQNQQHDLELIPPFSPKNDHVLPPIRWFWQVMDWMQTGTLAMSLDLFRESSLVPTTSKNTITTVSTKSYIFQQNSKQLLPLSAPIAQKLQKIREHIQQKSSESLNIDNKDPFRIEFLIYAAIDYFFNQVIPHQQLTSNSLQKQFQLSTICEQGSVAEKIDDPWLSWNDLYPEVSSVNIASPVASSPKFLSHSEPSSHQRKQSFKKRKKRRVNSPKNKISPHKSLSNLQKKRSSEKSITVKSNHKIDKNSSRWIDTDGKTTGYVKHPLVRVLEWLDTGIHWLEKLVHTIGNVLRKRL